MSAPVPQAVGTLESTPFAELLVQAHDNRLTGTLVLEGGGARHGLYLQAGKPQKAKLAADVSHLGEVLVDTGAISAAVHERTLERALREHVLHGQLLLGEGLIDAQALGFGLREQLARQIVWLFGQPLETHYGFFDGADFLAKWGAAASEASTLEVLWRGVREHARPRELDAALERVQSLRIALRSDLPANHFAFMGDEDLRVLAFLRQGPRRITELVAGFPAQAASIQRLLYFLVLTRSVDLGLPSAPPVGVGGEPFVGPASARMPSFTSEAPTGPAPGRTPSFTSEAPAGPGSAPPVRVRRDSPSSIPPSVLRTATLRQELKRLAENPPRTHYDVLGIPVDAPMRQVQSAFFLLSKRWHPDRLGADADLAESASRVFESISRAYSVLADPATRAAYDLELATGDEMNADATPIVERALSAELSFHKAEAFLARGHLEAAEREAKLALEFDPKRPEHMALAAWLAALKPNADDRRIAADLARAVRAADGNVKVHWYRGLFLKRVGRHAAALQEFRFVSEKDPRHIDAAREVRIYEQRLRNSPKDRPSLAPEAPEAERSTWNRLFKRRT